MITSTEILRTRTDLPRTLSDDAPVVHKPPKTSSSSHSSRKSTGKSRRRSTGTSTQPQYQHLNPDTDNQPITVNTQDPKEINYELQVRNSNSDSGLSSPASSIDKANIVATHVTPLSSAKPRSKTRPKSQHIPSTQHDPEAARRLSVHTSNYENMEPGDNDKQVYTATTNQQENITYADLDPKAFMIPHNKVLPTDRKSSSLDSRSTYAEITSKPHYI